MNPHPNTIQFSPSSLQQFAKFGRFLLFLLPGGTWMFLFVTWLLHRRAIDTGSRISTRRCAQ